MIDPRTRIYMFVLGLLVLGFVINLVRKRQLQERYALLWLLAGLGLTLAPLFINQIDRLAYALGFAYPPALLLMLAVVGLLLIIFQLSLNISRNADQLKVLTQEVGLLRQQVEALQKERRRAGSAAPPAARTTVEDHDLDPA
jgi:hypothetical protein